MKKRIGYNRKKVSAEKRKVILEPESPFAYREAYKAMRTNFKFLTDINGRKKIIVTSALQKEGKTSVSINLAATLAENGEKVILIDCDLRNPTVYRYLMVRADTEFGLTSILTSEDIAEKFRIYKHPKLQFSYILVGTIPPNPAELLGSDRMKKLLETLSRSYDYIICDCPPVGVVTDAALLSRSCDGVLMVVRQNYASREQVRMAKQKLDAVQANIMGIVMNQYELNKEKHGKNMEYYY